MSAPSVLSRAMTQQVHRDPREFTECTERDYAALECIMEGYEEEQKNVHRMVFRDCSSKTPASRCIGRLSAAGYILVERWNGVGMNLLRGTNRGRAALVERGVDPSSLFVPERPLATKDRPHHSMINIVRHVLKERGIADVTPCWALRRKLADVHPPAIPDVLAFRTDAAGATQGVLAVEVDMGTEPLKVFIPKMGLLREMLASWAGSAPAVVLVLTVGPRRILAMEAAIAAQPRSVPVVVLPLPKETGRSVDALAELLQTFS